MECGIHRCTFNCGMDFSISWGQSPQWRKFSFLWTFNIAAEPLLYILAPYFDEPLKKDIYMSEKKSLKYIPYWYESEYWELRREKLWKAKLNKNGIESLRLNCTTINQYYIIRMTKACKQKQPAKGCAMSTNERSPFTQSRKPKAVISN